MKKIIRPALLGACFLSLSVLTVVKLGGEKEINTLETEEISSIRKQHMEYLDNSPFEDIKHLSKKERKALRLPPNKYYDQMWELSMNPATGRPELEKMVALRKRLSKKNAKSVPGDTDNPWVERGPNNVGGRTRTLLFDPNDNTNRRVYSGGVSGGLWVNNDITNANSQWTRVENVPGNLNVTSITVDPRNSNNWYLGTGEQHSFNDVIGNGVYRSTNGGTTWQAIDIPAAGGGNFNEGVNNNLFLAGIYYVNKIIAWDNRAENRTELFVGVGALLSNFSSNPSNNLGSQSAGLYRSIDNGATWNRIETANFRFTDNGRNYFYIPNDFEIGQDNRLWMSTVDNINVDGQQGGRIFSTTNGNVWAEAGISPLADTDRVELEASATDRNKLYALVEGTAQTPVEILLTTDGFANTRNLTRTALPNDADMDINANDFTRGQAFYDLMIESDPSNDDIVYVGGIDLFRSTNSGDAWTQISKWSNNNDLGALNVPSVHADQHVMAFRPGNNNQAIFGNDGGVYYASGLNTAQNNVNSIQARNNGYNVTQFVKASVGPESAGSETPLFLAGAQDNGTQIFRNNVAGVNSSEEITGGDGFFNFIDKDGELLITSFQRLRATRFNLPWNGVDRGTSILNFTGGPFLAQMGYDSDANFLMVNASGGTVFNIIAFDVSASAANENLVTNALLDAAPTAFMPSPFADNTWLVGLANGNLLQLTNVGGAGAINWAAINTPFVGSISSVRFGATANDIMVTIHNYGVTSVWATTNGGANWVNKEGNLPDMPVRDLLQNPLDRNEVILATQLGVWRTNNFNQANPNWVRSQNGMSDVHVTSFDYWAVNDNDNNNTIIASTYGRGIFTGEFTANNVADTQAPTIPANLTSSNITQTSVNLSWTASQDNVGVTGYDVLRDGVVIQQNLNATNFQVTGLTEDTTFRFNVRARDAAGNMSANSNTVSVTTRGGTTDPTYCAVAGNINDEFIGNVTIGSINNTSQGSTNGYGDFTAMSTNLSKGTSTTITITPTWTGGTFSERYAVWIDYNGDGDFEDAGEQVFTQGATTNTPVSGNFTVPDSAADGATRMRVMMSGSDITSSCGANGSIRFGEIEDYAVNITGGTSGSTCNDNIQNGTETGVDCGGTCAPCDTEIDTNEGVVFVDMADQTVNATNTWRPFNIEVGDNNSFGAWISGGQLRLVSRENDLVVNGATDNITVIGVGVQVGATSNFNSNVNNSLVSSNNYTDWNGESGFIGFRFLIDGNTHYGWFHINVSNNGSSYTITDYAYNSNANQPLTTVVRNNQATASANDVKSSLDRQVTIAPNPFKENFVISTSGLGERSLQVIVYDITGKTLVNKNYSKTPDQIVLGDRIGVAGSYFVRMKTDSDTRIVKLIKQ